MLINGYTNSFGNRTHDKTLSQFQMMCEAEMLRPKASDISNCNRTHMNYQQCTQAHNIEAMRPKAIKLQRGVWAIAMARKKGS